jgi:hypothetical protein
MQGIVFGVYLTIGAKNGNPHAVLSYVGNGHLRIGRSKDRISDARHNPNKLSRVTLTSSGPAQLFVNLLNQATRKNSKENNQGQTTQMKPFKDAAFVVSLHEDVSPGHFAHQPEMARQSRDHRFQFGPSRQSCSLCNGDRKHRLGDD